MGKELFELAQARAGGVYGIKGSDGYTKVQQYMMKQMISSSLVLIIFLVFSPSSRIGCRFPCGPRVHRFVRNTTFAYCSYMDFESGNTHSHRRQVLGVELARNVLFMIKRQNGNTDNDSNKLSEVSDSHLRLPKSNRHSLPETGFRCG